MKQVCMHNQNSNPCLALHVQWQCPIATFHFRSSLIWSTLM